MIDDSEGAFRILAYYPSPVSPLESGESGFIIVEYQDPRGHINHEGTIQITSDDPTRRITNVTLVASPAPHTGVTTLITEPTIASEVEGDFEALIDPDGNITEYSVTSQSNIGYHTADLISDEISIRGQVANKDAHAQMILEVRSTSSPEKLEIFDIIIIPYHLSDQYPISEGLQLSITTILLSSLLLRLIHHRFSQVRP